MERSAKQSMTENQRWILVVYLSVQALSNLNSIFKCFVSLCLPHLCPPWPSSFFKEVLFSQVVFSPPTYPPPPSLPPCLSCWKWLSVYFYPLLLSSLCPFHPFSLSFKPPLLLFFDSLLSLLLFPFPWKCCIRTFRMLSGGGTFAWWRDGKMFGDLKERFF